MPFTPLSVAGVHRRMWRRRALVYAAGPAAAYGAGAADAASAYRTTTVVVNQLAQPAPAAAAPPAAAPQSTEGKLRQLKSMLNSGLITQSQFDAKRKQLLANF